MIQRARIWPQMMAERDQHGGEAPEGKSTANEKKRRVPSASGAQGKRRFV